MKHLNLSGRIPVLFDHDGSADDFISLLLLLSMNSVDLLGISITPADCYVENALETTLKIAALSNRTEIPISIGHFNGINAFPADWRAKPRILNALPDLINVNTTVDISHYRRSPDFIVDTLLGADQPITILITGPCSNLVRAIEQQPAITDKIGRITWMGGAVDVGGNVRTYNHNGTAEWNVFWDPISATKLLTYNLAITLIPLDVTNSVAVSVSFLKTLALQSKHLAAKLAGQFWATTLDTIPSYEYTYFMWDVLATSYLAIPEAFVTETTELAIACTGANAGQTYRAPGSKQWVSIAKQIDKEAFYTYLLRQLTQA